MSRGGAIEEARQAGWSPWAESILPLGFLSFQSSFGPAHALASVQGGGGMSAPLASTKHCFPYYQCNFDGKLLCGSSPSMIDIVCLRMLTTGLFAGHRLNCITVAWRSTATLTRGSRDRADLARTPHPSVGGLATNVISLTVMMETCDPWTSNSAKEYHWRHGSNGL